MTAKEAIENLKAILEEATETEDAVSYVTSVDAESLNLAIEALKKQTEHSQNTPQKQPDLETFGVKTGETCADAISRRVAIDEIRKCRFVVDAIEKIIGLPPAQPEQRWIPVSERLPEDEYVLISKIPTKISGNKWSVAIAIRTADPRSRKIQWRDSGFGVIQDDKVLAWMPLPEPYLERRTDEDD